MNFRYADEKDTALILQFIKELADYENMLNEVVANETILKEWISLLMMHCLKIFGIIQK